ncbi:hypothetical protein FB451DRAFT_1365608 [Mycena latifolia]|nr:hypothetical protein FB451DRAFT_1365608 [Mycena latifolia]
MGEMRHQTSPTCACTAPLRGGRACDDPGFEPWREIVRGANDARYVGASSEGKAQKRREIQRSLARYTGGEVCDHSEAPIGKESSPGRTRSTGGDANLRLRRGVGEIERERRACGWRRHATRYDEERPWFGQTISQAFTKILNALTAKEFSLLVLDNFQTPQWETRGKVEEFLSFLGDLPRLALLVRAILTVLNPWLIIMTAASLMKLEDIRLGLWDARSTAHRATTDFEFSKCTGNLFIAWAFRLLGDISRATKSPAYYYRLRWMSSLGWMFTRGEATALWAFRHCEAARGMSRSRGYLRSPDFIQYSRIGEMGEYFFLGEVKATTRSKTFIMSSSAPFACTTPTWTPVVSLADPGYNPLRLAQSNGGDTFFLTNFSTIGSIKVAPYWVDESFTNSTDQAFQYLPMDHFTLTTGAWKAGFVHVAVLIRANWMSTNHAGDFSMPSNEFYIASSSPCVGLQSGNSTTSGGSPSASDGTTSPPSGALSSVRMPFAGLYVLALSLVAGSTPLFA